MHSLVRLMKALSDPNRLKIVKILQHRSGMCVCELKSLLHIAQPTVSKHLKVLEDAGVVEHRKDGLWVNYSLVNGSGNTYVAAILENFKPWLEDQPEVSEILNKTPFVYRKQFGRTKT